MRILHLASEYPPQNVYGLGRFVRDLAKEQNRQGHEVTVLTNSMGSEFRQAVVDGVHVLRVNPPPPKPSSALGCLLVFNILLQQRALDLGSKTLAAFDVVCSHDWLTAPASQAIGNAFGIAHISTFHDTIFGKCMGKIENESDWMTMQAEQWTARAATHVIANSRATRLELIEKYGGDPERISVVPCAISPEDFQVMDNPERLAAFRRSFFSECALLILYVGRLDPEKGVDVLLNAFAESRLPQAQLGIVGTGIREKQLKKQVEDLHLQHCVKFLGYVENPALACLYRCADVVYPGGHAQRDSKCGGLCDDPSQRNQIHDASLRSPIFIFADHCTSRHKIFRGRPPPP